MRSSAGALVFETAHDAVLDERLNRLSFYTWGDNGCCLPRGATRATLRGHLAGCCIVGDILMFEEVVSPTTFVAEDADRTHRWAVRLTEVTDSTDPSGQLFDDPPVDAAVDVTEIAWDAADALPFPLCLSVEERPGLEVSVALGNIVLADHGRPSPTRRWASVPPATAAARPGGVGRLLRQARAGSSCRRASVRRSPTLPLSHGFDLAGTAGRADQRRRGVVAGKLAAGDRPARRHAADRPADRHAGRRRPSPGRRAATCWPARTTPPTSSSRSRTTAARACVSATTTTASGPIRAPASSRPTASATALPAMSAPRRSPTS